MSKKSLRNLIHPASFRQLMVDLLLVVISFFVSLWIRLGWAEISEHIGTLYRFLPLFVVVRMATFVGMGVYNSLWRYVSIYDAKKIVKAVALSSAFLLATSFVFVNLGRLPRSIFFIDFMFVSMALLGVRLMRRMVHEAKVGNKSNPARMDNRLLIYGAGVNGRALAQRIETDASLDFQLVGFIDDDSEKQGRMIAGYRVLGGGEVLEEAIESTQASHLIIAMPQPPGEIIRDVVATTRKFNIQPQVITEFARTGDARKNMNLYREIRLSDLLNRKPTEIDITPVSEMIRGKRVLVTGAGGSIGSELARQIARLKPSKLLLLDHSEYNLYEIDKELRLSTTSTDKVAPLLIDIKDKKSLETALEQHAPDLIFHAAAYKHVHLVEANPFPSILNNVLGTQNLLDIALKLDVDGFVLISTDKAVNPAGVMGSTKRVCEFLTSAAGKKTGKPYCSVRFGNVLGSSGSLIPLLKKQIEEGGPVTITHQDMTRYFMLIPEAVSLVLMAAAISKPGDINVLKMGEPVKIVEIARSLITLMGRTEEEVPILFTGLRPGEKMFEELYISGNELETNHPDILTLPDGDVGLEAFQSTADLEKTVARMIGMAEGGTREALLELNKLVKSNYKTAATKDGEGANITSLILESKRSH